MLLPCRTLPGAPPSVVCKYFAAAMSRAQSAFQLLPLLAQVAQRAALCRSFAASPCSTGSGPAAKAGTSAGAHSAKKLGLAQVANIIAVASGKGGVGKSTTAGALHGYSCSSILVLLYIQPSKLCPASTRCNVAIVLLARPDDCLWSFPRPPYSLE